MREPRTRDPQRAPSQIRIRVRLRRDRCQRPGRRDAAVPRAGQGALAQVVGKLTRLTPTDFHQTHLFQRMLKALSCLNPEPTQTLGGVLRKTSCLREIPQFSVTTGDKQQRRARMMPIRRCSQSAYLQGASHTAVQLCILFTVREHSKILNAVCGEWTEGALTTAIGAGDGGYRASDCPRTWHARDLHDRISSSLRREVLWRVVIPKSVRQTPGS